MLNFEQEQHVLKCLSLTDMENAQQSILKMNETEDEYLKEVLFRDAVISYIKPFSDNRGINQKKGLRLNQQGVPHNLKDAHKELEDIRNKLFAHNELEYQQPSFGVGTSFSVKGYNKVFHTHLVGPLHELSKAMHRYLLNEVIKFKNHAL